MNGLEGVLLSEAEESTFNEVDQPIPLTPDRPVLLRTEGLIRHPLRFLRLRSDDICSEWLLGGRG